MKTEDMVKMLRVIEESLVQIQCNLYDDSQAESKQLAKGSQLLTLTLINALEDKPK
jgi:hypothetical protein